MPIKIENYKKGMEDGYVCSEYDCIYPYYTKGIECENCCYYKPYILCNGSKILIDEDKL